MDNKETSLKWYYDNKDHCLARTKQWKLFNKEKDLEHKKKYREQTYICDCGTQTSINHKSRHEKTKKHLNFMTN